MFAALLLILGGGIGLLVEVLRFMGGTVKDNMPDGIADFYPQGLSLIMTGLTLMFGIFTLRTHAAVWGYSGAATGLGSLAYSGLVPFLSLVAIGMLIKSRLEGEETRNDGVTLHPSEWPDKAMAASLFIVVGGAVVIVQGISIALDRFDPILIQGMPWLAATLDIVAGLVLFGIAREVYNLRRPFLGTIAVALGVMTLGLYVLGPVLAIITFVLLRLAAKEGEFNAWIEGRSAVGAADA